MLGVSDRSKNIRPLQPHRAKQAVSTLQVIWLIRISFLWSFYGKLRVNGASGILSTDEIFYYSASSTPVMKKIQNEQAGLPRSRRADSFVLEIFILYVLQY